MSLNEEATVSRWTTLLRWFDSYSGSDENSDQGASGVDWLRTIPFIGMHVAVLGLFWVGWSPVAVGTAMFFYALRMFAITGFYHRYFSHKSFRTSRTLQFIFGVIGASSVQRGPLWWAANHRIHHAHADKSEDVHSPVQHGFLWSHMCWFLSRRNFRTRLDHIRDFARFPELRFIDRYDVVVPTLFAVTLFLFGQLLAHVAPDLGTNGWQMLVWGFVISTVVLYHMTFTITSLAHQIGYRRYDTPDTSRNHFILALITFGEGWHNNHHFYPSSARQGFRWWELDLTYYILRMFQMLGLIWDMRPVPARVLNPHPTPSFTEATREKAV
ncbi:MAG: stearoyl-CoA 9-desaturase [Nitrospira bacterium SG8_3]|nr:MAG: stearoyl-CoA 9-desaturase [Nitrospira bacterium SG8_3]